MQINKYDITQQNIKIMIILIKAEKALGKIQHPLMKKTLNKLVIKEVNST